MSILGILKTFFLIFFSNLEPPKCGTFEPSLGTRFKICHCPGKYGTVGSPVLSFDTFFTQWKKCVNEIDK